MSNLVKEACTLRFIEHEFVEFFGMVSPLDEDACSYTYSLYRDGLRLEFTIFPIVGAVSTDLFRDGISEPIATSRLRDCTHSRLVSWGAHHCLEIGRPEHPTWEIGAPLAWGLRLFVEPHFRLQFIHEVA